MSANIFVDNAKVMSKGQITIPKDIRDVLGVSSGDRITFIVEGNTVRIVNSPVDPQKPQKDTNAATGDGRRSGANRADYGRRCGRSRKGNKR